MHRGPTDNHSPYMYFRNVRMLLERGCDPNRRNYSRAAAIHYAAKWGWVVLGQELEHSGKNLKCASRSEESRALSEESHIVSDWQTRAVRDCTDGARCRHQRAGRDVEHAADAHVCARTPRTLHCEHTHRCRV